MKSDFTIIESTKQAEKDFGCNYGSQFFVITKEDIEALLNGKELASEINCGEYSIFIKLEKDIKEIRKKLRN